MYDVAIGRRIEGRDDVSRALPTRPNQGRRQRGRLIQFIALYSQLEKVFRQSIVKYPRAQSIVTRREEWNGTPTQMESTDQSAKEKESR
jgi:hypothetical protein